MTSGQIVRPSRCNDEALRRIMNIVEMPDRMAENLIRFIRLNEGKLGRKRREGEFEKLTDDEVASIEAIVQDAFEASKTNPATAACESHGIFS